MRRGDPVTKRFDEKFEPEPMSGCWLWTGVVSKTGYGSFWRYGSMKPAHRVSYSIHVGAIPEGLSVLHRCDTPTCVNPRHLFVGTHLDNMADMRRKGRHNGTRKIRSEHVQQIKALLSEGWTLRACAARFGVSHRTIGDIKQGIHVLCRLFPSKEGPQKA